MGRGNDVVPQSDAVEKCDQASVLEDGLSMTMVMRKNLTVDCNENSLSFIESFILFTTRYVFESARSL
jgi:hypothetical protein